MPLLDRRVWPPRGRLALRLAAMLARRP